MNSGGAQLAASIKRSTGCSLRDIIALEPPCVYSTQIAAATPQERWVWQRAAIHAPASQWASRAPALHRRGRDECVLPQHAPTLLPQNHSSEIQPRWQVSPSSPLSTYMFARDSITGAENKPGAISEHSIPDCVKCSFCDFLMWFTIQWQPKVDYNTSVIIYFILIQSSPAEPSRILTVIFNWGVLLLLLLLPDPVIPVALLLFVEREINKFFLKHLAPHLNTNQRKAGFLRLLHSIMSLCSDFLRHSSFQINSMSAHKALFHFHSFWVGEYVAFPLFSFACPIHSYLHIHVPGSGHSDSSCLGEES